MKLEEYKKLATKQKKKRAMPEADLQIAIVEWFNRAYPEHFDLLHHSPNGGFRLKSEAVRLQKMGVKAGFPDLVLFFKRTIRPEYFYAGLAIELKAKGEKPTDKQNQWLKILHDVGFISTWSDNFEEATKILAHYMHPIKPRVKV